MKEQCKETWSTKDGRTLEYGCYTFNCVREANHEGQHFDHYGRWNEQNVVPLERAHQEMNIMA